MRTDLIKTLLTTYCAVSLSACGGGGGGGGGGSTTFSVNASAGSGGSISATIISVTEGSSTTITVTSNEGFEIASVTGCNGALSGETYTTGSINADCTITASFTPRLAVWDTPEATWDNVVWQ